MGGEPILLSNPKLMRDMVSCMVEVVKTLELNLLSLTNSKDARLSDLLDAYRSASNELWEVLDFWDEIPDVPVKLTRYNLQHLVYRSFKAKYGLQAQHLVELVKDVYTCRNKAWRHINNHVSFNIPRSGGFKTSKRGNPLVSVATLGKRMGLPIAQDGAYKRFQEHLEAEYTTTHFRLIRCRAGWKLHFTVKKEVEFSGFSTVLGVDVGVKRLAAITILGDKVIKQDYLGLDIGDVQRNIGIRRSKLRSGDNKKALRGLKGYEANYVKTRMYQVAREIVNLAIKYNSCIAIEDLTNLNRARGNKKSNRKSKRLPYKTFRVALESVAWQAGIPVIAVNPAYTSQTCPRCGNRGIRNKSIFKCGCGYIANADRSASHNIALRASQTICDTTGFSAQISEGSIASSPMCSFR